MAIRSRTAEEEVMKRSAAVFVIIVRDVHHSILRR